MNQANKNIWSLAIAFAMALPSTPILAQGSYSTSQTDNTSEALFIITLIIVGLLIFFIPSVIAFKRHHPNRWPILLINTIFGGTGLGWIGSLIWAMSAVHMSKTGNDGGESGLNIFANDPVHVKLDQNNSSSNSTSDTGEQLTQIKNLFDQNAITQIEYDKLRKPLIEQLANRNFDR